jgi:hypothetical protein
LEPRPPEGFQELQKVGRHRQDVRRCVAPRAGGYMTACNVHGGGECNLFYVVAILDTCFATVWLETRNKTITKELIKPTRFAPLAIVTIQLQRNVVDPVLYATIGDKRCVHGCMSGLPNTSTLTLFPPPLVSFFASPALLLSGSLVVVSRPVEGLGMPQRDVQSSGREASWLLARFTSCRDNEIPTAV